MSSRSIGVTNVGFSRWMMSCVMRSPSCSQTTTSRSSSPWSGQSLEHPLEQLGGAHELRPGLLEEVEELAFLGREELGQPAHRRPVYVNELLSAERDRGATGELRPEAVELLRGDPVGVLGAPGSARVRTSSA